MLTKQIKNRILLSAFLIVLTAAQLGVLFLNPKVAKADSVEYTIDPKGGYGVEPPGTGNCATDKIPIKWKGAINRAIYTRTNSQPIGLTDDIQLYVEAAPVRYSANDEDAYNSVVARCNEAVDRKEMTFKLEIRKVTGVSDTKTFKTYYAKSIDKSLGKMGVTFPTFKLKDLPEKDVRFIAGDEVEFIFWWGHAGGRFERVLSYGLYDSALGYIVQNDPTQVGAEAVPNLPDPEECKVCGDTAGETAELSRLGTTIGIKDRYRVLLQETDPQFQQLAFGKTPGLDSVKLKWTDGKGVPYGTTFQKPAPDEVAWWPDLNPDFLGARVGFFYATTPSLKYSSCKEEGEGDRDCKKIIFDGELGLPSPNQANNNSLVNADIASKPDFQPILYQKAWYKQEWKDGPSPAGKAYGEVAFDAIPMIGGRISSISQMMYVVFNQPRAKFVVEVFEKQDDIIAACIEGGNSKETCTPQFARYGIGKDIVVETTTTAKPGDDFTQTLYGFILRVISDIIIWLQSIIYRIFAYIIVPILNALLKVRPYQDIFVNIIYPGWLILRNLANIFFIVSLLVVGLRILFQQSAAATARSFIIRLVLMALLVNFSLVIGQGIVGIADTVQSQFLPANSRVIEALGSKLMVEPLKTFREQVTKQDDGVFNSSNSERALSDTVKPLVLLLLSVAAFFSFLAVAAFLTVRLVALWVLYMLSPIAYVGYVMDETKQYAKQWWNEFLKYAIITPVLVFFLNIAALMATIFPTQQNTLFKFSDGSTSGDIVTGSLTILTHFIVLFFIFAGMKFAMSSGTFGSKAIVDYAKKGFQNTFKKPAQLAGSVAKTQYERKIKGGMLDPLAYRDAFKKHVADTTKQKYTNRMLNKADKFSPAGLFESPGKTMKYLLHKATGGGSQRLMKGAEAKTDESEMLTADERRALDTKRASEAAREAPLEGILERLNAGGTLSVAQGRDLVNHMNAEALRLRGDSATQQAALRAEATMLRAAGNVDAADAKDNQAVGVRDEFNKKIRDLEEKRDLVDGVLAALPAGATTLSLDGQLKDDLINQVDSDLKDLVKEIKTLNERTKEDDRRIADYGSAPMDLDRRRELLKAANQLNVDAGKRSAPQSSVARQIRREAEDEAKKKIEETDDSEELVAQYKNAMAKNNLPLASAIAKKLASEGSFADLLKANGYRNNMQAMQEFISKDFKKYAPQVRMQMMSEIGTLNEKNGNRAASRVTKIDTESGVMRLATPAEHNAKHNAVLSKKSVSEVKRMKKNEFGQEGADGRLKLYSGAAKMLNQLEKTIIRPSGTPPAPGATIPNDWKRYNNQVAQYRKDWAPTAKAILEATNSNLVKGDSLEILKDIAK